MPPTVFLPQPNVESSLVEIVRRDVPAVPGTVDRERLFRLVSAGFGQRRKMLRRSLASLVDPEAFAAAGVRPEARAEELGLDDWARLAAASPTRTRGVPYGELIGGWCYLPARRCQRVAFSIFLCFFLRIRLRRFFDQGTHEWGSD